MNRGVLSFYKPSGQFGNQMFQLHFLRQIEKRFNFNLVHGKFRDLENFGIDARKPGIPSRILKPPRIISQEYVKQIGFAEFEIQLEEMSNNKKHVFIEPGFLGQYFLETQYYLPSTIFPNLNLGEKEIREKKQVAIHFRGTDFHSWDTNAIMGPKYYEKAIHEILGKYSSNQLDLKVFTDDPQHETVRTVAKIFGELVSISKASAKQDFLEMCKSDIIIHSPSTFSFWASLLGERKENIYSKTWLDYKTMKHDKFWSDFRYKGFLNSKINLEI